MKTANGIDEIREWAIQYGGNPQIIDDPESSSDKTGIRINFPGVRDDLLLTDREKVYRDISWDEFFEIMNEEGLMLVYEEDPDLNNMGDSYRFVNRE